MNTDNNINNLLETIKDIDKLNGTSGNVEDKTNMMDGMISSMWLSFGIIFLGMLISFKFPDYQKQIISASFMLSFIIPMFI